MDDYLKEALEIVKAQASVRTMTEDEITSMVQKLASGIKAIAEGGSLEAEEKYAVDPKKAIREKTVLCCVCGKSFKILTKKHLASHGLTADEYREKFGYKKKAATCMQIPAKRTAQEDERDETLDKTRQKKMILEGSGPCSEPSLISPICEHNTHQLLHCSVNPLPSFLTLQIYTTESFVYSRTYCEKVHCTGHNQHQSG